MNWSLSTVHPRSIVLVIAISSAACSNLDTSREYATSEEVWALSDVSKDRIGVSLAALAMLAQWSPHSYVPLDYLQRSGRLKLIEELEKEGLVIVHQVQGLPDGTQQNSMQVRIEPIGRGVEIVAAFRVLLDESSP